MSERRQRAPHGRLAAPGLAPSLQRLAKPARFGFSWRIDVSPQKPPLLGLGFAWISLDSLVRIETFQWVKRHKAQNFCSRAFSPAYVAGRVLAVEAMWKSTIVMGKA